MPRTVVEIVNWLLAIAMWLFVGRATLDWLTRGRVTVIGRLFHLLTDPIHRPTQRLFPLLSPAGVSLLLALLFLVLRVTLVFTYALLT